MNQIGSNIPALLLASKFEAESLYVSLFVSNRISQQNKLKADDRMLATDGLRKNGKEMIVARFKTMFKKYGNKRRKPLEI